ncbi:MAG: tyrosine-type recombinase/integrase [Bacteroidota bacterium]|nr:tyrosine-type recombinase/integrase [Bacteroidota bacterium]
MLIDSFHKYLKNERRYSPNTISAYISDVTQFFSFINVGFIQTKEEKILDLQQSNVNVITIPQVRNWIYALSAEGLANKSINRKRISLNSFYKFLIRAEQVNYNPVKSIPAVKGPKRVIDFIPAANINQLLDSEEYKVADDFISVRDRLILELCYGAGLRRAELIELQVTNIDLAQLQIKVLGKRSKQRIVPITKTLVELISTYLTYRANLIQNAKNLFLTPKGDPLYPVLVDRLINRELGKINNNTVTNPHSLRHSYATELLNNGADINAIKELLGHSSLAATQVYTHTNIARLKEIYKLSHPKSKE